MIFEVIEVWDFSALEVSVYFADFFYAALLLYSR